MNINLQTMEGISFVTDENNNKIAVQISYDVYGEIIEDIIDGLVAESRKDEESIPFDEFVDQLKAEGLLDE